MNELLSKEDSLTATVQQLSPILLLLGPPGAGKGVQAIALAEYLELPHVSTGDLFRKHIEQQTPLGKTAQTFMDQGRLVPDNLVFEMLFAHLQTTPSGCILDGFPRTVPQAIALSSELHGKAKFLVINFQIGDAVLVQRLTGRLVCEGCKRSYHKIFDPPQQEMICNVCSSNLFTRSDDQEEVITRRLQVYYQETQPLIEYYSEKGILRNVDASHSKEQVLQDISVHVKNFRN